MITHFFVLGDTYIFSGDGEREYVHVSEQSNGENGGKDGGNNRFRRIIGFLNRDLSGPSAPKNIPAYKISYSSDADRSKSICDLLIYGGNKPRLEVIGAGGAKINDDVYVKNCISVFNDAMQRCGSLKSDPHLVRLSGLLKKIAEES